MANTIHVDIVSPEGQLFSGEATMVFAPAANGDIGIAPRHAPLLTTLRPGEVRVQVQGEEEQVFYVGGGALEIRIPISLRCCSPWPDGPCFSM
jgi:F-type H+-transporting ATPase subunit epsilon